MSSRRIVEFLENEIRAVLSACWGGVRYGVKIRAPHALVMTFLFRDDLTSQQKIRNVIKLAMEHAGNLASFALVYKSLLVALKWASAHLHGSNNDSLRQHNHGGAAPIRLHRSAWRSLGRAIMSLLIDGPIIPLPESNVVDESSGTVHVGKIPRRVAPPGHPENVYHSFVAGAAGGYLIWGRYSSVNYQIVLYLTSRVLVGLGKKFLLPRDGGDASVGNTGSAISSTRDYYPLAAALVWGTVMALFEDSPEVLHSTLRSSMDEIYRSQHFARA